MLESDKKGIRQVVDTLFHDKAEPGNRVILTKEYDEDLEIEL
jgi:hypothetical protein